MGLLLAGLARETKVVAVTSFRPHKECLEHEEKVAEEFNRIQSRSLTSSQLAHALRPDFEAHGRRWSVRDVRERVARIDPGAKGICGGVLNKLQKVHRVKKETSTKLIQGLALCLRRRGSWLCRAPSTAA